MNTTTLFTILGFVITALSFIGALITVWVNLTNKLTLLEARLGFGDEKFNAIDKKFDEVMMHLRRIEDKLDNKADR
tara:strand:- start:558 stop:785 length:228 start_codon:yes stop_codon:yes gene_type:complete